MFALNNQRLAVINAMVQSLEPLVVGLDPELGGSFSVRAFRDIGFLGRSGPRYVLHSLQTPVSDAAIAFMAGPRPRRSRGTGDTYYW